MLWGLTGSQVGKNKKTHSIWGTFAKARERQSSPHPQRGLDRGSRLPLARECVCVYVGMFVSRCLHPPTSCCYPRLPGYHLRSHQLHPDPSEACNSGSCRAQPRALRELFKALPTACGPLLGQALGLSQGQEGPPSCLVSAPGPLLAICSLTNIAGGSDGKQRVNREIFYFPVKFDLTRYRPNENDSIKVIA